MKIIKHNDLKQCDLIVNALYKGGQTGNLTAEVISKILPVGNVGGFRPCVGKDRKPKFVVLKTSLEDEVWPDKFTADDKFIYYGDNRRAGETVDIHSTKGNKLLRNTFLSLYEGRKEDIPLFFIFVKAGERHDVKFSGLAVPAGNAFEDNENLVATWKRNQGKHIFNYKAVFEILSVDIVSRDWINDIINNDNFYSDHMPNLYREWLEG